VPSATQLSCRQPQELNILVVYDYNPEKTIPQSVLPRPKIGLAGSVVEAISTGAKNRAILQYRAGGRGRGLKIVEFGCNL